MFFHSHTIPVGKRAFSRENPETRRRARRTERTAATLRTRASGLRCRVSNLREAEIYDEVLAAFHVHYALDGPGPSGVHADGVPSV